LRRHAKFSKLLRVNPALENAVHCHPCHDLIAGGDFFDGAPEGIHNPETQWISR